MRCWERAEAISAYADDELPQDRRLALEAHLAECPTCRDALEAIQRTTARLRALGKQSLSLDIADEVVRRAGL
jgi:anti-sigma factor RsiW